MHVLEVTSPVQTIQQAQITHVREEFETITAQSQRAAPLANAIVQQHVDGHRAQQAQIFADIVHSHRTHVESILAILSKSPHQETAENCPTDLSNTSFRMQLSNAMNEVVRADLRCADQQPIISPAKESVPNLSSIMAASDVPVDPTLQKEMNFMKT